MTAVYITTSWIQNVCKKGNIMYIIKQGTSISLKETFILKIHLYFYYYFSHYVQVVDRNKWIKILSMFDPNYVKIIILFLSSWKHLMSLYQLILYKIIIKYSSDQFYQKRKTEKYFDTFFLKREIIP